MESSDTKKLVMIGIRRKGEKGFKTRIRKDMEYPISDVAALSKKTKERTCGEISTS